MPTVSPCPRKDPSRCSDAIGVGGRDLGVKNGVESEGVVVRAGGRGPSAGVGNDNACLKAAVNALLLKLVAVETATARNEIHDPTARREFCTIVINSVL